MDKSIYVTANEIKVANVIDFRLDLSRDIEEINGALETKFNYMKATIKRVLPLSGATDGIVLRALSDFKLALHTPTHISLLKGCRWERFSERVEENRIIEEMTVVALEYSMLK